MTTTSHKEKYGVRLRAEPDHKTLGFRLKGAFKAVMASIKQLGDEALTAFQKSGSITVDGHDLGPDDIRLIYTFDGQSKDTPSHYEAHSDGEVSLRVGCHKISKIRM